MNRNDHTRSGSAAIACAAALLLCWAPAQAQPSRQVLHGHVRAVVSSGRAALVGSLPAGRELGVSIVLPLRNQAGLTALLAGLYDPSSPNYRHFLSVEQFTGQFGPTADDYQAVIDFARSKGLTVTDTPANRLHVPVRGTVAQIEKAFNVSMKVYLHPTEKRTFFSPDREPSLDLGVRVAHIAGLNDFSIPRPMLKRAITAQPAGSFTGSGPGGAFLGSDMRAAYYGGTGLTGSGQAIGLLEFDGYNLSDVNLTFGNAGQSYSVPIENVLLDGATGAPVSGDDGEEVLDIVQAIGVAPGLSQVRVYIGNSDVDILSAMASENIAKQISISWTWLPEDPATDDVFFQEMAAQGQSVFAASGDDGTFDPYDNNFYPAEDAFVTAVGGTVLYTNGAGGSWSSETAWSHSGGGISPDGIAIPSWQAGVANAANGGSSTLRNVPDVAMEADFDNYYCDMGACAGNAGGTSFAAPRWAAFLALVNQQAAAAGNPPAGFINPAIYNIGESSSYNNDFHDITIGSNNLNYFGVTPYYAAVGYDLVTGWGSPAGQNLIDALAPPAGVGFRLSASASSLTINPGNSGATTIAVTDLGGFTGSVNLTVSGLPSGVTAAWGTNPTAGTSVLTLTVGGSAVRGSYLLTIAGTSGAQTATTSVALAVNAPGFTIAPSPSTLKINPGTSVQSTLYVTNYAGFNGAVNFAVTSPLPAGVTAVWNTGFADGSAVLMLTASNSATVGSNLMVTITGTSGTLTATATIALTVLGPGFILQLSPFPYYLVQGGSVTTTVTMVPTGSFIETATLSAPYLPTGVTATFSPVSISPGGTSTLTLTTSGTAPAGWYTAEVNGTSGCCTGSNSFPVVVSSAPAPDFSITTSPVALMLTQGGAATTNVTVQQLNGFTNPVKLTTVNLPAGVTASFSNNRLAAGTVILTLSASNSAVVGEGYDVTVNGDSTSASNTDLQHIADVFVQVNPSPGFTLSAAPASVSVSQGSSVSSTIAVTPMPGFTGSVSLSAYGLPSGVTAQFATNPTTGTSVVTLTASASATPGTYPVTIAGASGTLAATLTLPLTVNGLQSFSLSANPSGLTIAQGASGVSTITLTGSSGFTGGVTLAASNLPSGVTASFSPNPATGSSTLTLTAGLSAAAGAATVTITGTSASASPEATTLALLVTPTGSAANEWAWMSGNRTIPTGSGIAGVYGSLGVPAAGNIPGGRIPAGNWIDGSGNLWFFGGFGYDANASYGSLNDLWEFNRSTNQWAWMGGSSTIPGANTGNSGVYGVLGVPAAGNIPGGRRWEGASWTDSSGHFWLFGGLGYDANGSLGTLNDLWEFNPSTNQWAWMGGTSTVPGPGAGHPGVYGVLGIPAPGNIPGGRYQASAWADASGHLWLFGGYGYDANGSVGYLNDLWEFNPSTNLWAWMSGTSTVAVPFSGQCGHFGTLGIPAAGNIPGGRQASANWTDGSGNLWLFGGGGCDARGMVGPLNDLWEFSPSTNEWAWMSGSSTIPTANGRAGTYGSLGVPSTGNVPGGRQNVANWTDAGGNLWLFGGYGNDANGSNGYLNDLWEFSPFTNQWVWMGGSSTIPAYNSGRPGVYGTLGVPAAGNIPGGRQTAAGWTDGSGNFWLFGGLGYDANGAQNYLSDLWKYPPSAPSEAGFVLAASPGSLTVAQGASGASTVTVSGAGGFTGSVTLAASGLPSGVTALFSPNPTTGTSVVTLTASSSATPGSYSAVITGTSGTLTATAGLALRIAPGAVSTTTTLGSSANPSFYGNSVTFTATVSPSTATGTVQFLDGTTALGTAAVSGGSAVLAVSTLTTGAHSITAVYSGDAADNGSTSAALAQTVNPMATGLTLASSANPSTYAQSVTFTATVTVGLVPSSSPTGTVQFLDGTAVLGTAAIAGGSASLAVSTLTVGAHAITAVYSGDANYLTSTSAAVAQTVNKVASSLVLHLGLNTTNPMSYAQPVSFYALLTPSSGTGTVQFLDGTTSLATVTVGSTGSAVMPATILAAGVHTITAVYSGDAVTAGSTSAAIAETITQATVTYVTLSSSPNPAVYGQPVTLSAWVSPPAPGGVGLATGTMQFMEAGVSIGSATLSGTGATLVLSSLAAGTHTIYASYGGDANIIGSDSLPVSQVISTAPTSVTLASSVNPSTYGQTVTLTAAVTPAAAPGTVQFLDGTISLGTATIAGGAATLAVSTLTAGAHSITAVYSGSANYAGSTSAAVAQTVNKAASSLMLASSANPSTFGQSVVLTATMSPGAATGTVQFLDGATSLGTAALASGSATLAISTLTAGAHSITAVYSGDANFLTSTSAAVAQTVNKVASSVTLASSANPSTAGQSVTFTATVSPASATGTVQFLDGATSLGTATLASGSATLAISTLTAGAHSITAVYSGDANYLTGTSAAVAQTVNKVTSSVTLASSANPAAYGQSVTFTAVVSPASATGTVQFLDGATVLGTATIASGSATLAISTLTAGAHSITAAYLGDANDATSTSPVVAQTVNQAASSVTLASSVNPSAAWQAVTYTATVLPSWAGGTV
jgi:N-acetylneuraminic acid mutarotase